MTLVFVLSSRSSAREVREQNRNPSAAYSRLLYLRPSAGRCRNDLNFLAAAALSSAWLEGDLRVKFIHLAAPP